MAVSKRLRYEILRRDNHACRYCGATAPNVKLTIDHVTPQTLGGTDTPDNLVTACADCNGGKTSMPADAAIVADVATDAARWATAIKQAATEMESEDQTKLQYRAAFEEAWNAWTYEYKGKRETFDLPDDWRSSVERYRLAGLPAATWSDIIEPGMTNPKVRANGLFRYTCGVANNRLVELQGKAHHIIGDAVSAPGGRESSRDPIGETLVSVWESAWADEYGEMPSVAERTEFRGSVASLRQSNNTTEPQRLVQAADYAKWFKCTTIDDAIDALDRDDRARVVGKWVNSWLAASGEFPDHDRQDVVIAQCDALRAKGVDDLRVQRAATFAGATLSARLYFGLGRDEISPEVVPELEHALELWSKAFTASANRRPTIEERKAFLSCLHRLARGNELFVYDINFAAAASGAYQDADPSTCMTRRASVFEAAAQSMTLPA